MRQPSISKMAAGLLLALLHALPGRAEPTIKETVSYYSVDGATAAEIRADINRRGPLSKVDGTRYAGLTNWRVSWNFSFRNGDRGCAITATTVSVDIEIQMPSLVKSASHSPELVRAFAEYSKNLLLHERGHAENGIDTGRRIETGIRALAPKTGCDQLKEAANTLGHSLIKEGNRLDIEYDARTQHGRTQGARFP